MGNNKHLFDCEIATGINLYNWKCSVEEGRLMLMELMSKAAAGYYNSHTEEGLLKHAKIMRADRTPTKKGYRFLCAMIYEHSSLKPYCYELMEKYRR